MNQYLSKNIHLGIKVYAGLRNQKETFFFDIYQLSIDNFFYLKINFNQIL